ncbi:hypothetical protein IG631_10441 [Alternaria alternata]|nr:hypothetical protein IG631_10441 [Alternaria alternata]
MYTGTATIPNDKLGRLICMARLDASQQPVANRAVVRECAAIHDQTLCGWYRDGRMFG